MWMNQWDICEAEGLFRYHPVLGPATRFLREFVEEVNSHSDGWPYWSPPSKAADQLMNIIEQQRKASWPAAAVPWRNSGAPEVTRRDIEKALVPIKAFYTRYLKGQYSSGRPPADGRRMKLPTLDWAVQQELLR